jgi:hypothetical protein
MQITNNLTAGKVYKNYKELCLELGEHPKTGNARLSQLKEWERYFSYTKQGHKYIINEVFQTPRNKYDMRSYGNNVSLYMDEIEILLLDLLAQERNQGEIFLSRNMLLKELKMINDNYSYYRNRTINLSKFMNVSLEEINEFYESSNSTLKSNLETALNRLKKQSLIYWTYAMTVCYISTKTMTTDTGSIKAIKHEYINEDGEKVISYDTVKPVTKMDYRKATQKEINIILEIERETLKKYNFKDKSQLFKYGMLDKFYNDVKEALFERTNIIYYYNSYEIIFNDKHIQERLNEIRLQEHMRERSQTLLNTGVIDKIIDNAKTRHDKANEEIENNIFDDVISLKTIMRSKDEYIHNSSKLTKTLINKDHSHININ